VGKLYRNYNEENPESRHDITHPGIALGNQLATSMNSSIIFEGLVARHALDDLINRQTTQTNPPYHPDQDLICMNIMSWARINFRDWRGKRIGNKFYPLDGALSKILGRTPPDNSDKYVPRLRVYDSKTGFFTSMRPGIGSMLLNVNATTSVFYPNDMNLQEWINRRWGHIAKDGSFDATRIVDRGSVNKTNELKGLKGFCDNSKRTIVGVHEKTVSEVKFGSPEVSVFEFLYVQIS